MYAVHAVGIASRNFLKLNTALASHLWTSYRLLYASIRTANTIAADETNNNKKYYRGPK